MNSLKVVCAGPWIVLLLLAAIPVVLYWLFWVLGRAWYAGRLSAIRWAFNHHFRKGQRSCVKKKTHSVTGPGTKIS